MWRSMRPLHSEGVVRRGPGRGGRQHRVRRRAGVAEGPAVRIVRDVAGGGPRVADAAQ